MKYWKDGLTYGPLSDDTIVINALEGGYYELAYVEMVGWRIYRRDGLQDCPPLFGSMAPKVDKVFEAFERRPCNTGVLLSGRKGLGKSLFMRHVARLCIEKGYPVFLITKDIMGIAEFLAKIRQPCVLLMDEFDKNFMRVDDDDAAENRKLDTQRQFYSLFDGLDGNKRLVLATANDVSKISEFFLNRPGRFYYHLRFMPPTADETVAFMRAKGVKDRKTLERLRAITAVRNINYDSLHAIADELMAGKGLKETITDLNVNSSEHTHLSTNIDVVLANGLRYNAYLSSYDMESLRGSTYNFYLLSEDRVNHPRAPHRLRGTFELSDISKTETPGVFTLHMEPLYSPDNENRTYPVRSAVMKTIKEDTEDRLPLELCDLME